jgi:hypothetical protein
LKTLVPSLCRAPFAFTLRRPAIRALARFPPGFRTALSFGPLSACRLPACHFAPSLTGARSPGLRPWLFRLWLPPFAFRSQPKLVQFFRIQFAELARLHVQHQRPVAHTPNLLHAVPDLFEHLPQFAIAALGQHHFVPRIVSRARLPDGGRRGVDLPFARPPPVDGHALAKAVELLLGGLAAHLHQVALLHPSRRLGQLVRQVAVVGHQ